MFIRLLKQLPTVLKSNMVVRGLVFFVVILTINTLAMMKFEGMGVGDALWFSFTTATTVGYGDISPVTAEGRITTVILMYVIGIYLMAAVIGILFEHFRKKQVKEKMGLANHEHTSGHIVLMNVPKQHTAEYLLTLQKELCQEPKTKGLPILVLDSSFSNQGLPEKLSDFLYVDGSYLDEEALKRSGVVNANYVFIFGDKEESSDARAMQALARIRELKSNAFVLCEYGKKENRPLLKDADILVRQVRAYPEMLIRSIASPGVESIFENLFESAGNTVQKVVLDEPGRWDKVVLRFMNGHQGVSGIPIASKRVGHPLVVNTPVETNLSTGDCIYLIC